MSIKYFMCGNASTTVYRYNNIILSQQQPNKIEIDLLGGESIWDAGDFFEIIFRDNVGSYTRCTFPEETNVSTNNATTKNSILDTFQNLNNMNVSIDTKWLNTRWVLDVTLELNESYTQVLVFDRYKGAYAHSLGS
jgi:hypothetical protein